MSWDWPHLRLIQDEIEDVLAGRNDRLLVVMPVRHGKSEQTTIRAPAYALERNPSTRIITGCHSADLANRFSRKTRQIVRERGIPINPERRAAHEWETIQGGGLRAAGRTGGVMGYGGHGLILDDMVKSRAEAESKAYREGIWDIFQDDFLSRLEPGGWVIVVMTWWHHDDLIGRILKTYGDQAEGGEYRVIRLAALAEERDPLGRKPGEALCPDRFTREQLLRRKERILPSSWNGLYQGRPTPREGAILLHKWIGRYTELPDDYEMRVQSWDTGTKPKERDDPSVCTTWRIYRTWPFCRLESEWRGKVSYPDLKRKIVEEAEAFDRVDAILIEDKGNGTAAIQELRRETMLIIVAVTPVADKLTRFEIQSNHYRLGHVAHPDPDLAPWVRDFDEELTTIPAAPNDDRGDSVSQLLAWWGGRGAQGFTFETAGRGLESRRADAYVHQ